MKTWPRGAGRELAAAPPPLGPCRPRAGRCCHACAPGSWGGSCHDGPSGLGFRDAVRVTEESTRYRGWLVRRVCGLLAAWGWKVPADAPGDLPARVCSSRRVRDVAAGRPCGSGEDGDPPAPWREKILKILAEIQAPLSAFTLRLCGWALRRFLSRLFLNVQLHRGQLEMVLRAAGTPGVPLVFLSTHKSPLDGLLLSYVLFSQGLAVPRVTVGSRAFSPRLRALLGCLGGIFLPSGMERTRSDEDEGLPGAVLAAYVEEVLRSRQPLLIFLEEPCAALRLSASARVWLAAVYRAVRDGAVPDVLVVPVGITYDVVPSGPRLDGAHGAQPLGLAACFWAACRAVRQNFGFSRVDFAQPFSLQEFVAQTLVRRSYAGEPLAELLPAVLGAFPSQLDGKAAEVRRPSPATATGSEAEEEMLVTALGLHSLSDGVACSAIMAVGVTSVLLLHKHRESVFMSRLLTDFVWLVEEILLRHHDVGFSGQPHVLLRHSLTLLAAHVSFYRVSAVGDILVVPKASAEALRELSRNSAAILPVFASEAVGACAIRASVMEVLPFLRETAALADIVVSQKDLRRKTLELLRLLPLSLLGLRPCQPLEWRSEDIVDKLLLCGLLETEEPESDGDDCTSGPWLRRAQQHWDSLGFSDSGRDDEVPKRCFRLSEPQNSPGFLLFLCRLLSPVLRTYARAVAFLERPSWPQPEAAYVEALLRFLDEEDGFEHRNGSLALSSLHAFKEMGVLEEVLSPGGPVLHLGRLFRSSANREKLAAFIQQFLQP